MHNFVHIEIKVTDFNIAKNFYGKIFKWHIFELPGMTNEIFYRVAEDEDQVGGGFLLTEKIPEETSIMLYINTDNIDSTLKEIDSHDGTILMNKTELPGGHGFIARFRDPFGNILGLWSEE